MSNTATINSPDGVTISRIKPTILSGHMSDIQWNTFCEDTDRALAPASELKKLLKWFLMIRMFSLFGVGLPCFLHFPMAPCVYAFSCVLFSVITKL